MESDLRLVFMGTPSFAVPSLDVLVKSNYNVVAVVTAPDKPHGRGRKQIHSPVKQYAIENNLPLLQPENLKSPEFLEKLTQVMGNLYVVVAFRMLPESVWALPSLGTFNLHASWLPHYRGAAPIPWAIINGEKETGVTTFFINHKIDMGNIIFQQREVIRDNDNAGTLHDRLMESGARLVLKTVKAIAAGECPSISQKEALSNKLAPKITKSTCEIDWRCSTHEVINFVRGMNPYPGAWTTIGDQVFKIVEVSAMAIPPKQDSTKQFITDNKHFLRLRTADGWVAIDRLQPEGRRKMTVEEFFRGNKINQ